MKEPNDIKIGIIGLGYVGLPLAVEFGKLYQTTGLDINRQRIKELLAGKDRTLEVDSNELKMAEKLNYTDSPNDLSSCNVYIITVPTPIDSHNQPDLSPLISASNIVGKLICPNDIVIYESTVYPGATEEVCVPILEKESNSIFNIDFFVGYSPERINPGDKEHRLPSIKKVTSGSTPETANFVDNLYNRIIAAGTHKATSIKVAEAAKVIENTQRDLNIALINELAIIFNRLDIDTLEVLEAAGSKWNFLPFRPGLVGGHCIGVDPYYLTYKAQEIGYHPEVILAGRKINDGMGAYITEQVIKMMLKKRIHVKEANILILGVTFKENCPDLRNTRVLDIANEFLSYGANIDIHDPWANSKEAEQEYSISLIDNPEKSKYDAIILAVAHNDFIEMGMEKIRSFGKESSVIFDIKSIFSKDTTDARL